MGKFLFNNDKNIYKANLHCHTIVSDGTHTPKQIKEMYKANGYNVVAFTDHNILKSQSHLDDDSFLALNSCEVDLVNDTDAAVPHKKRSLYHFNLYARDQKPRQTPPPMQMDYHNQDAINEYIEARVNEGYLVCYNHPNWSMQTFEEYSKLKGLFAMEIYNHGCEVTDGYYGYNPQVYDEMLRATGKLFCISADDNHNREVDDSFGGFVMISATELTYDGIIDALVAGDFYATQGPEIHEISVHDGKLRIKCSESELIVVYTDSRQCHIKKENKMTEVEFTLYGDEKYVRVMCRDTQNKDANSNAYWL